MSEVKQGYFAYMLFINDNYNINYNQHIVQVNIICKQLKWNMFLLVPIMFIIILKFAWSPILKDIQLK